MPNAEAAYNNAHWNPINVNGKHYKLIRDDQGDVHWAVMKKHWSYEQLSSVDLNNNRKHTNGATYIVVKQPCTVAKVVQIFHDVLSSCRQFAMVPYVKSMVFRRIDVFDNGARGDLLEW